MKPETKSAKTVLLALLALCGAAGGWGAQSAGQNSSSPASEPRQATAATSPEATRIEDDAYEAVLRAQAGPPVHLISLGEEFIAGFPMSAYRGDVYSLLTVAYRKTNQVDQMMAAGKNAVASHPDDVDALSVLAWAMPREANAGTAEGQQQLEQAGGYARHALDLLATMTKPSTLDDAGFAKAKNEDLSLCHSGLGVADVKTGKYADGVIELTLALQLASPPSWVDYYMLGIANEQLGHFHDALEAFGQCAVGGSSVQSRCMAGIDDANQRAKATAQSRPNKAHN